ncbi:MAG TPA: OsmC family protein [Tepidisphaeraceae bacterium]|jgi:putative redox protein|nr:OsmC family protein [Tepidisphaeraceae bacterium]
MIEIQIAYEGNLRCSAKHLDSGAALLTDAPKDNMGKGESFSPTDLVAAALGTCMLTIMGIAAQRMNIDLTGTRVVVVKEMVAAPMRRIGRLAVTITVPLPLSAEQRQKLQNAAMTCPVHKSLHPDVQTPITFNWG